VAAMCSNTPEMLELHNAVPLIGGVLNSMNIRLDAATIAFILNHGEAKVIITDTEFSATVKSALEQLGREILVVDINDSEFSPEAGSITAVHIRYHRQSQRLCLSSSWRLSQCTRQPDDDGFKQGQSLPLDLAHVPLRWLDLYLGSYCRHGHPCLPQSSGIDRHFQQH